MKTTRRAILQAAAGTGTILAAGGCEKVISGIAARMGDDVPQAVVVPDAAAIDPVHHLLNRAGYGPWPGQVEQVRRMGVDAWIDQQLDPSSINDAACTLRARRYETVQHGPRMAFEYDREVLRRESARHTLLRAVYSQRQLQEVMTAFWSDHFNVSIEKGDCVYLKSTDDREVIRPRALGRFSELVRASATSAAMLVYLDGDQNQRATEKDVPNENYARELMELHTLGVDGGYTQVDVSEAARALTGWRVRKGFARGSVYFDPAVHDDGAKQVLGETIPGGLGEKDTDRLVEIVCRHPATANHIATKLVRRFVSDDPPAALVQGVAATFTRTDGDIRAMVGQILRSDEFKASAGGKYKPPFRFVASSLRTLAADTHAGPAVLEFLNRMGHGVFQHPTPDGYPDTGPEWAGTLLWRWNFAFGIASGGVEGVRVPLDRLYAATGSTPEAIFAHLAGREPTEDELHGLTMAWDDLADGAPAGSASKSPSQTNDRSQATAPVASEPNSDASEPQAVGAADSQSPSHAQLIGVILSSAAFQRY